MLRCGGGHALSWDGEKGYAVSWNDERGHAISWDGKGGHAMPWDIQSTVEQRLIFGG